MAIQSPFFIANELVQYPTAVIECEPHWENVFRDTSEFLDYVVANIKVLRLCTCGVDCLSIHSHYLTNREALTVLCSVIKHAGSG